MTVVKELSAAHGGHVYVRLSVRLSVHLSNCLSFGPWWEPIKGSFQLELSSAILRSYDDDDDDFVL